MSRKSILRIVCGICLNIAVTIFLAMNFEGWRTSVWTNVINGAIAVVIIFPPILKWAKSTTEKHKTLSVIIMIFIISWSCLWGIFAILVVAGVLK